MPHVCGRIARITSRELTFAPRASEIAAYVAHPNLQHNLDAGPKRVSVLAT